MRESLSFFSAHFEIAPRQFFLFLVLAVCIRSLLKIDDSMHHPAGSRYFILAVPTSSRVRYPARYLGLPTSSKIMITRPPLTIGSLRSSFSQ